MKIDGGLRGIFREHLPQIMWTSIETGGTGRGIADSNFLTKDGIEGWIEFKKTEAFAVTMRPEQVGWIERRIRYGGRTWIGIRQIRKDGDHLHLVPGFAVRTLATEGLRSGAVSVYSPSWNGGPANWPWRDIAEWLARPTTPDTFRQRSSLSCQSSDAARQLSSRQRSPGKRDQHT